MSPVLGPVSLSLCLIRGLLYTDPIDSVGEHLMIQPSNAGPGRDTAESSHRPPLVPAIRRTPVRRLLACCLVCTCLLIVTADIVATTILGIDIDQLTADAEFIFEGEVVVTETREDSRSGIISTYVTFNVVDVMKGDYDAASIELKFMGGAFEGRIVQVSGLKIPQMGEQGIYFVESTSRDLINPLLGWSQGHFIIVDDDGERKISTAHEKPVTEIQSVSGIPLAIKKPQALIQGGGDAAAGVTTESSPILIRRALSVDEFKARIQDLMENQRVLD